MEEKQLQQARNTFATICKMMDNQNWHYDKDESDPESLVINSGARGDDLPIDFRIIVDAGRQLVSLHSSMPFRISEEKRVDGAIACCMINYALANGCFDYDIKSGVVLFRLATSYRESLLSEELFSYVLNVSMQTIDEYNDKLLMISKGMITLEQFAESF